MENVSDKMFGSVRLNGGILKKPQIQVKSQKKKQEKVTFSSYYQERTYEKDSRESSPEPHDPISRPCSPTDSDS